MCKITVQEGDRLVQAGPGQSHPEECARQDFSNADKDKSIREPNHSDNDKSRQDSRCNSRRNRDQQPVGKPQAVVTTTEHERPPSANEQDVDRPVSPPPSAAGLAEEHVVYKLSKLLSHMAGTTAAASEKPVKKTCSFGSQRVPQVSLSSYASRIKKFFRCTDECFVLCLVFIDRIVKSHPEIQVTELTCHRLLLISSVVAAKFHDDEYASNSYFAKVGGIEASELNALEAEFMELINWRLFVKASDYDWYLNALRGIP